MEEEDTEDLCDVEIDDCDDFDDEEEDSLRR